MRGMWLQKNQWDKKDGVNGLVAVAIDTDKGSQNALKWAIDHLVTKGSTIVLIHVNIKTSSSASTPSEYFFTSFICNYIWFLNSSVSVRYAGSGMMEQCLVVAKDIDDHTRHIFNPYRVFCARKDVSFDNVLNNSRRYLIEYAS